MIFKNWSMNTVLESEGKILWCQRNVYNTCQCIWLHLVVWGLHLTQDIFHWGTNSKGFLISFNLKCFLSLLILPAMRYAPSMAIARSDTPQEFKLYFFLQLDNISRQWAITKFCQSLYFETASYFFIHKWWNLRIKSKYGFSRILSSSLDIIERIEKKRTSTWSW